MGDAGSLGLGFVLATMAMELLHSGNGNTAHLNLNPIIVAIAILGYPIVDTLRVFTIRIAAGQSPFTADRRHIHHVLLDKGFTHFGTTTFIMACVGGIVFANKMCAPHFNSHLMILLNLCILLGIHLFVRPSFGTIAYFLVALSHERFLIPVKKSVVEIRNELV